MLNLELGIFRKSCKNNLVSRPRASPDNITLILSYFLSHISGFSEFLEEHHLKGIIKWKISGMVSEKLTYSQKLLQNLLWIAVIQ